MTIRFGLPNSGILIEPFQTHVFEARNLQVVCFVGVPDGIRTRVTAVKGRCPNRWTTGTRGLTGQQTLL